MTKQRSKARRGAALLLTVALAMMMAGCSDTSWGAQWQDIRMPAGVYINNVISAYSAGVRQLPEDADQENVWKNTLDGIPFRTWVANRTEENVRTYFAVEDRFQKLGLEMDEITKSNAEYAAKYQWDYYKGYYEENGVGEASFLQSVMNNYKSSMVFDAIYGKDGTEPVADDELLNEFNRQYASLEYIYLDRKDTSGNVTEESTAAAKEKAEDYKTRLEKGETVETLAKEYAKEKAEAQEKEFDETTVSYATILTYENSGYSEAFVEGVRSAEKGKPVVIEDENYIRLVVVQEVTVESEVFLSNRDYLLAEYKGDEYEERLLEWGRLLDVTFNSAAVKRYDAKNLKNL